jgi:hypothetical protein
MTRTVSAVIPTVGRQSLIGAVQSVLDQTRPVAELIVVVDTDQPVNVPTHDRITVLRTPFRGGPAKSRQLGIDAARGSVIALLDDDDEWYPAKLERQLAAVDVEADPHWIVSSRMVMVGPGNRQRILPRRIIGPQQSLAEYWFRFSGLRQGGAALQTSTLCFPTELARKIRWDAHVGAAHDEPSWLINVQRAIPELRIIQLPDVLGTYNVQHASESRRQSDCTESYIDWGLQYLSTESGRLLGDYLCTSPVSAAVSAGSLRGVRRSLQSAFRHGRPGPFAVGFALLSAARILGHSTMSKVRR